MRSLVSFLGYYKSFIADFSRIAKPLYELLCHPKTEKKQTKEGRSCHSPQLPPSHPVEWPAQHQQVLDRLVDTLSDPPVLAYPHLEKLFVLHIDVSEESLGAILYQCQGGVLRVIGYGS